MSKKTIIYKIVYSITEAIIPSLKNVSIKERKNIVRETSEFNMSRINGMAIFLRVPIKIILYLFNLISILTIKKLFSSTSNFYRLKHIFIPFVANIGYYTLIEANLVGNDGYVFAIEPSPSNVDMFSKECFS